MVSVGFIRWIFYSSHKEQDKQQRDEISAYSILNFVSLVTIFLIIFFQDMVIQNALNCLRTASSNLTDSYSLALFSYTFTLAGDQHASDLFKALQGKAIKEGQQIS